MSGKKSENDARINPTPKENIDTNNNGMGIYKNVAGMVTLVNNMIKIKGINERKKFIIAVPIEDIKKDVRGI